MFLRVLLPLLAIISVNSDQDLDAAKARCNLVDNPKGRVKPTDGQGNYCNDFENEITGNILTIKLLVIAAAMKVIEC